MADAHFYFFSEVVERFVDEAAEEGKQVEDAFVALLQVLFPHCLGQTSNKRVFFFDIELFPDINALFDIVTDSPLQLYGEAVFFTQLFESFEVFAFLEVLGPNVTDQGADPVDVVGQTHDADNFDEDEAEGLLICGGVKISEAYCEHDVDSPVIGPDILFVPLCPVYVFKLIPILMLVNVGHGCEEDGEHMCEAEVEEYDFDEGPVLFIVVILDEKGLQFFHFLQALRQLEDNKKSQVVDDVYVSYDVDDKDEQAEKVDDHAGVIIMC